MPRLPLTPIFSAAHISKWDALPEDTPICATSQSKLERTTWQFVTDQSGNAKHDGSSESSKSDGSVFSMYKCDPPVAVDCVQPPSSKSRDMAAKTYTWITLWFLLTAPIILWDVAYCFMRPRSMVGGDLHWFWKPYGLYQEIDYVYGVKALEEKNGFTNAQSLLNLVETTLNLAYVYLAHFSGCSGAPLIGFAAVTMTLSKTVLYLSQEYYCGLCAVGHNGWDNFLLWTSGILPWLVFPSMIVWRLGSDIIDSLSAASQNARRAASGKTQ